jgi:hypothetical protein
MFGISALGITLMFVSFGASAWGIHEGQETRATSTSEALARWAMWGTTVALWVYGSFAVFFVWSVVEHVVVVMSSPQSLKHTRGKISNTTLIVMGTLLNLAVYGLFQFIR